MSSFHNHSNELNNLLNKIPSYEDAAEISDILAILSDPTRIRILWILCHASECVTDLSLAIGMSAPAVSHHLKLLKTHKIITAKKIGKEMQYSLADNKFARLIHKMIDDMLEITCPNTIHDDENL
ncbi:MAG: ArsR/SmtB family transcription factor [Anaeroplasma sp.]